MHPVCEAAGRGDLLLLKRLVSTSSGGLPIIDKTIDLFKRQPSHCAAEHGHVHVLAYLVHSLGVKIHLDMTDIGETPMHYAARKGQVDALKWMFLNGASDAMDYHGNSLLHCAANEGQTAVIEMLLDDRLIGDVDALNHDGLSALKISWNRRRWDSVCTLLEMGADPMCINRQNVQAPGPSAFLRNMVYHYQDLKQAS
jgi:ankyrin repeat protein